MLDKLNAWENIMALNFCLSIFIGLLTLSLSHIVFADVPTEINATLKRVSQENDLMPALGRYKNQLVENIQRRTLVFLTQEEKKLFKIRPHVLAFANFRHNKIFHVAYFNDIFVNPVNGEITGANSFVEKVILSKKHWAGKTRPETKDLEVHAELLFYFRNGSGITLVYNQNSKQFIRPLTLGSAVLSVEAIRPVRDENASFFPYALGPNFAIGHRVISLFERNMQHKDDPERTTSSHRLDLRNTSSRLARMGPSEATLITSLMRSHSLGRNHAYDLFTNNCTNNIFDVLDTSLVFNKSLGGKIHYNVIKNDVVNFVNSDLKDIIEFLEDMSSPYQQGVDAKTRNILRNYLAQFSLRQASDLNMEKIKEPKKLLYQVPAFIDAHLKARGLIPMIP